jgi:RNA polymerase sigma-70 factor (ECF subfamily)
MAAPSDRSLDEAAGGGRREELASLVAVAKNGDRRAFAAGGGRREELASLVAVAKNGHRRAFAALYQERLGAVSRYVMAMVRDQHRAEDVVAQTFLLAWKDLPKLRKNDRFDAWLFRIAHNQAMTELRRHKTTALDDAPEPEDTDRFASPEGSLDSSMDALAMRAAMTHLPEPQREVLQLRFFQDLSADEIAGRMGKSHQAVYALQYRALKNLRQLVEAEEMRSALSSVPPSADDRAASHYAA